MRKPPARAMSRFPRDCEPRDPHAAERGSRHGGPPARYAAGARAGHLCAGHQDLGRRRCSRSSTRSSISPRSRPARPNLSPNLRSAPADGGRDRTSGARAQGKGIEDRAVDRADGAPLRRDRRWRKTQAGAAQSGRQRREIHRGRRRRRHCRHSGRAPRLRDPRHGARLRATGSKRSSANSAGRRQRPAPVVRRQRPSASPSRSGSSSAWAARSRFESDVGVGSIFRFELPLVIAAATAQRRGPAGPPGLPYSRRGRRPLRRRVPRRAP